MQARTSLGNNSSLVEWGEDHSHHPQLERLQVGMLGSHANYTLPTLRTNY